ncbi:MAG: hypothetical protein Ct9H90mP27_5810 [Gammaproteobacteria bacterium]|nr:MAG: hypothetical protein Ct9H90mP27_5810 [Gammaproteobacteria bacterium]
MSDMLSGGDMLIRALQEEGVDCIFGYPGCRIAYLELFLNSKKYACFI